MASHFAPSLVGRKIQPNFVRVEDDYAEDYDDGPNVVNVAQEEKPSLVAAAQRGDLDAVRRILETDDNCLNEKRVGCSALHYAVFYKHLDIIQALLDSGADADEKNLSGMTPLAWAAKEGFEDILNLFIEYGADIDSTDADGITPLYRASLKGDCSIVDILLGANADVNIQTKEKKETPLYAAVISGTNAIISALLKSGSNIFIKNANGITCFHRAASKDYIDIMQLFIDSYTQVEGNDILEIIDMRDNFNRTPLHWAAFYGAQNAVRFLLDHKADHSVRDRFNITALDLALRRKNPCIEVVKQLSDAAGVPLPEHLQEIEEGQEEPVKRKQKRQVKGKTAKRQKTSKLARAPEETEEDGATSVPATP